MRKAAIAVAVLLCTAMPLSQSHRDGTVGASPENQELINITVHETWEMLNNESDGREVVVDVRTFGEYYEERIATPHWYDKPILYPLQLIQTALFRNLFIKLFHGQEVILYCRSANRSCIGGNLLVDSGFEGTLYNMVGGIIAWKAASLPTVKGLGFGS